MSRVGFYTCAHFDVIEIKQNLHLYDTEREAVCRYIRGEARRLGVTLSETKPNKSQIKRNKTAAGQVLQKKAFTLVKVEVEHFSKLLTAGEATLQNGGFCLREFEPARAYSVEVKSSELRVELHRPEVQNSTGGYRHVFYFMSDPLSEVVSGILWKNALVKKTDEPLATAVTEIHTLATLAWVAAGGTKQEFQLWQLEVGDEEVRNDFKHVKPVDSPLSDFWTFNAQNFDNNKMQIAVQVTLSGGEYTGYQTLVDSTVQQAKSQRNQILQQRIAEVKEHLAYLESSLKRYKEADGDVKAEGKVKGVEADAKPKGSDTLPVIEQPISSGSCQ